jgi:hypothetical protein
MVGDTELRAHPLVLHALEQACATEAGGWATPYAVGDYLTESAQLVGMTLRKMADQGLIERWRPLAGGHFPPLYRPRDWS